MKIRTKVLLSAALLLLTGIPFWAFSPVATITSSEPFIVDGHTVAVSGITSVTLALGNEVGTANSPVVLCFADGSSVKLGASSRAKLVGTAAMPKLILLSGSLDYKLVLGSTLSVTNLDVERASKAPRPAVRK